MKDYVKTNQEILDRWANKSKYTNFAPDGIMYLGEVIKGSDYISRTPSGKENEMWDKAMPRVLFVTKDQNAGDCDAWDVREEVGTDIYGNYPPGNFYRNLLYQFYGLMETSAECYIDYEDFTDDEAKVNYLQNPLARINVKKQAGGASVTNSELSSYLNNDQNFILEQIKNLEPDIIVCCSYSSYIPETGNLILNCINENGYYHFEEVENSKWLLYDSNIKVIAINNYHLSARYKIQDIYEGMIGEYYNFLMTPDGQSFLNKRK